MQLMRLAQCCTNVRKQRSTSHLLLHSPWCRVSPRAAVAQHWHLGPHYNHCPSHQQLNKLKQEDCLSLETERHLLHLSSPLALAALAVALFLCTLKLPRDVRLVREFVVGRPDNIDNDIRPTHMLIRPQIKGPAWPCQIYYANHFQRLLAGL